MSKRTERRAAEREARKAAYNALRQNRAQGREQQEQPQDLNALSPALVVEPSATRMDQEADLLARAQAFFQSGSVTIEDVTSASISEAQLTANRANAQLSTGPITREGKAKSAQNALKHGLTGHAVLLPSDDAADYQRRLEACKDAYQPVGEEEQQLIQSIVDSLWRINRAQNLQIGIMYKGGLEFANQFAGEEPARRRLLIEVETYLKYEKSIRNLQVQEARLHRRYEKDTAELNRIQQARKARERQAVKSSRPNPSSENGFDFSTRKSERSVTPQPALPSRRYQASAAANPLS